MKIRTSTYAELMLLHELASGGSIPGSQIFRQALDSVETRLDQRSSDLFQMDCGWMSPEDQTCKSMDLLDGVGSNKGRTRKSIATEPALVEWSGGRRKPATNQCSCDMRATGNTPLKFRFEIGNSQRDAGVAQFQHPVHHSISSIVLKLLDPVEQRRGQSCGKVCQQMQVVRSCLASHFEAREDSKPLGNLKIVVGGQSVMIADGYAREDAGGPFHHLRCGQCSVTTTGMEVEIDSIGQTQGVFTRISRARLIRSRARSLPSTMITSMRSGESWREVKAQRKGMNNCGFFNEFWSRI